MAPDRYKLFGVSLSPAVREALAAYCYDRAGVVDLEDYFEEYADAVPVGDPGADTTAVLVDDLVSSFSDLYDRADFAAARTVDPDAFEPVFLAGRPRRVSDLRDRFRAAATIQDTDLRTVQTAILAAALETSPDG